MSPLLWSFQTPYLAAQGGVDKLQDSLNQLQNTTQYWQTAWQTTFADINPTSSYYQIAYIATFIAAAASVFWITRWAQEMSNSGTAYGALPKVLGLVVVLIFLNNHGQRLATVSLGIHNLINSWQSGILEVQIAGVQAKTVLNDRLATEQARNEVRGLLTRCDNMRDPNVAVPSLETPTDTSNLSQEQRQVYAKLQCYRNVQQQLSAIQQKYESAYCNGGCAGLARFLSNTGGAFQRAFSALGQEINQNGISADFAVFINQLEDFGAGTIVNDNIKTVLYAMQWVFGNLMEAGEWLNALVGPIMLATSVLPIDRLKPIWVWLITFFSIGLMKVYYALLLGVMATVIAGAQLTSFSDLSFAFLLGFFAPLIAFTMATGGALAAIRGMASTGAQAAQVALQVGSSIASSIVSLVGRFL